MQEESAFSSEFPTLLSSDTPVTSGYQAALAQLRQGLLLLHDLEPGNSAAKRSAQRELLTLQKHLLQLLHLHFSPDADPNATRPFGEVLRQHRDEAGLTQGQLASFSGLSLSLIRKLEQGSKIPTRAALLALCTVPDLKLVPQEITTLPAVREASHKMAPNWHVSRGFDSVRMLNELSRQLSGGGGSIEQSYVYLDHQSASDWIQLCNHPDYVARIRESFPHSDTAIRIRELIGQVGLDVIALGPGDGQTEVRLVQSILGETRRPDIRFYLLDVSQPLLSRAFGHAMDAFNDVPGVFVSGIQGDFHHLPRYVQLHYTPARSHRRRVYLMLGNTMGNLDNEPQFFRHSLASAAPNDLFVFDVDFGFTESMDPKDIRRRDPAFGHPVTEPFQRWLSGPIRRYCPELQEVTFDLGLDLARPLAGSYGIHFLATAHLLGGRTKEFCMFQVRRYQQQSITDCLATLGWRFMGLYPFRGTKTRPRGVFLFQKQLPQS